MHIISMILHILENQRKNVNKTNFEILRKLRESFTAPLLSIAYFGPTYMYIVSTLHYFFNLAHVVTVGIAKMLCFFVLVTEIAFYV